MYNNSSDSLHGRIAFIAIVVLVLGAFVYLGIKPTSPPSPGPSPTPGPTPDVRAILREAAQLREERIYLVTLKFKRNDPLDPIKNLTENEWKAEHKTLLVGPQTYESMNVGQEVSSKQDWLAFVFDGDLFVSYQVTVEDKQIERQFFWQDKEGADREINTDEYKTAMEAITTTGKPTFTVPYAGATVTYILDKPLKAYVFVDEKPLTRYFIRVEVKNETLTLDLTKQLRNAMNTHEIVLEVPESVYNQTDEAWDPTLNVGSLILRGRLSTLHGRVIEKWTEEDPDFVVATTDDGKTMVVPKTR